MRPLTIILSRRACRRIDCAVSRSGVVAATFPVALFGLTLCASMISCEDAKADIGMSQPAQQLAPLRVNDAIRSHVAKADLRVGHSAQKAPPLRADNAIQTHVAEASRRFRIPAALIWAVMHAESAGDVRARSKKGAMGLMQIMPATWILLRARQGLGDDPFDPRDNILAGAAYLHDLHDRYGARGFLAAYNAGPGRYEDHLAGRRSLPAETVDYISTVGRRIDLGMAHNSAPSADERIAAQRSALFPRAMRALSVVLSTDKKRSTARSLADQLRDEERFTARSPAVQSADEKRSTARSPADQLRDEKRSIARAPAVQSRDEERSIGGTFADQSTDEQRFTARSPADQLGDEKRSVARAPADQSTDEERSFGGPSADQATGENRALSRSSIDRVAVDLSAIAPSSTGLFARVTSR